jgi:hypothetical protein
MARFVISTIQLMSPSRIPHSTFDALPTAATWISKNIEGVNVSRLAAAVSEARQVEPLEALEALENQPKVSKQLSR